MKVHWQPYHLLPWVAEGVSRVGDLVVPVLGGGGQVGHHPLLGLLHRAGGPVHVLPHLQQLTMQRNREIFIMFIEGWTKYFSKDCENFRDISLLPYSHRCRRSCSAPRRGRSCTGPPSAGRWSPALCSTPATICLYWQMTGTSKIITIFLMFAAGGWPASSPLATLLLSWLCFSRILFLASSLKLRNLVWFAHRGEGPWVCPLLSQFH